MAPKPYQSHTKAQRRLRGQAARFRPMAEIGTAKYIALTTYKKDGTPSTAPVWITGTGGTYRFTTGDDAWKARRLPRDPRVRVQACDMRGRVAQGTPAYVGTGSVKTDDVTLEATHKALAAKYGLFFKLIRFTDFIKSKVGKHTQRKTVAIELELQPE